VVLRSGLSKTWNHRGPSAAFIYFLKVFLIQTFAFDPMRGNKSGELLRQRPWGPADHHDRRRKSTIGA
jgi:hypothetical protein